MKQPTLPDWIARELPFTRRFVTAQGKRVHTIDHVFGNGSGPTVLLMHGNPTWCFLWRKVIHELSRADARVVAPDLVGFGLSDKPRSPDWHRLDTHVGIMTDVAQKLDLDAITIVGQDWGGPIVAGVGSRMPQRIRAAVFANTAVLRPARPFRPKTFHKLSNVPIISDVLFRGLSFPLPMLHRVQGNPRSIGPLERRAYRWPLRRVIDRAGPVALARMIPTSESHPTTAVMDEIGAWVESFPGKTALVWGKKDPILGRALRRHHEALPQARVIETEAGHFLQEEVPDAIADAILSVS